MQKPFFAWHNKELRRVHPEDVVCLATERYYTRIVLKDHSFFLVRSSMSGVLKQLPPDMFIKIHRSLVASVFYIDNISRDHLLINGIPAPIGKLYYQALMERLNVIE